MCLQLFVAFFVARVWSCLWLECRSKDEGREDGLWHRAKATLLSWNRVRSFAGRLQVKMREVMDLRLELEQLLQALRVADASCS